MYVDIDKRGKLSLQDITEDQAEYLIDALCVYLNNGEHSEQDKEFITLKKHLEQCISTKQTQGAY